MCESYDFDYDRIILIDGGRLMGGGSMLATTGVTICALLVGCGDGAADGQPSMDVSVSQPPGDISANRSTMAAFLKRAERICRKARIALVKDTAKHRSKDLGAVLAAALNDEADKIAALEAPSRHASQIDALVESVRESADGVEAGNDSIDKVERASEKAERWADALELDECFVYGGLQPVAGD